MSLRNQRHYKRTIRAVICIISLYTIFICMVPEVPMGCFRSKIPSLDSILSESPDPGSIFLIDTSCDSYQVGRIVMAKRDACAVESLARLHPNKSVYLLFASPGLFEDRYSESDRVLQALFTYKNVHVNYMDVRKFVKGTPAEEFVLKTAFMKSKHADVNLNNILRLVTIWRYKGIYVDFDVIAQKSFETLGDMFLARETKDKISNAVFGFSDLGRSQEILGKALTIYIQEFNDNFYSKGDQVMTKLVNYLCNHRDCRNVKIHSVGAFHPIEREDWEVFYREKYNGEGNMKIQDSFGVRAWNEFSNDTKIPLEEDASYLRLAFRHCPRVIGQCEDDF